MSKNKKESLSLRQWMGLGFGFVFAVFVFGAVVYFGVIRDEGTFAPQTLTAVFERDVMKDQGSALDPSAIVSKNQIHLDAVCSKEQFHHFSGHDGMHKAPFGVGANVTLAIMSGNRQIGQIPVAPLPPWKVDEETDNPTRLYMVKHWCADFQQQVGAFTRPLQITRVNALIVDTTDGIRPDLAHRIREKATDICTLGGSLYIYNLSQQNYQGGRQRLSCGDSQGIESALSTLLSSKADPRSSIYGGIHESFGELADFVHQDPHTLVKVYIFTDGVENTESQDFYHNPQFIDEQNWGALDPVLGTANLNMSGMRVSIYPTPDETHKKLVDDSINYLVDRFTKAGAVVDQKPF
jgi:hypothetical protein